MVVNYDTFLIFSLSVLLRPARGTNRKRSPLPRLIIAVPISNSATTVAVYYYQYRNELALHLRVNGKRLQYYSEQNGDSDNIQETVSLLLMAKCSHLSS
jgi:hypothetical protein